MIFGQDAAYRSIDRKKRGLNSSGAALNCSTTPVSIYEGIMKDIQWGGDSATDLRFLNIVKEWIENDGEVYVVLWFIKAAGTKNHYWVTSFEQFKSILSKVAAKGSHCSVDVYRHPQFPVRGVVTEDFIESASNNLQDDNDWFLIVLEERAGSMETIGEWGDRSRKSLAEELKPYLGKYALIGPDIHWPVPPEDYPGAWVSGKLNFE
jgi:hypothetical protein